MRAVKPDGDNPLRCSRGSGEYRILQVCCSDRLEIFWHMKPCGEGNDKKDNRLVDMPAQDLDLYGEVREKD